jgi:hypothetical protein
VRLASSRSHSAISASTLATMRCCSARGWKGNGKRADVVEVQTRLTSPISALDKFRSSTRVRHEAKKQPCGKLRITWPNKADMLADMCLTGIVIQQRRTRDACTGDDDQQIAFRNLGATAFRIRWWIDVGQFVEPQPSKTDVLRADETGARCRIELCPPT